MRDRIGEMWQLSIKDSVGNFFPTHRILVTRSEDVGNGRTRQHFVYFKDMKFEGKGDDIEYADFPWEDRQERKRIA